ncbi:MAG: CBS domain-containing protein [Tepidiformaceae bacterium]
MKLSAVLAAKGNRVFTITPGATIADAVAMLAENNIGALIVTAIDGLPVGMLSERDIIRRLSDGPGVLTELVSDLMTSPVTSGTSNDDADSVLQTMTSKRFRHLPVVDHDELVGMVTIGDLVKSELLEFRGAVATLETRLMDA